ncbi:1-aminocyclopropane-1-carboxylate deaminase/D-cysteine desulfhydrase [Aquimarina hainanensis]|uniref:1-aminocyclopropane-1-carboxylate deaminase/D-cysteine desulfhydrase n=1 Tax=Aquimarina hainanensis TaxID=1578017 RepID=A0ABW5N5S4_9FLAO|nr:pyridoxal-phosphate dependent enzyme [Aquimarina sp. TRL1]QKX03851.1 1-aminocyclopropane-1-carboxylate deaminase/D-cysteine desulfhydrase [Aquimarina sp. TRL1]
MSLFSASNVYAQNQEIIHPILEKHQVRVFIKREDLLHKEVSGNKFRKLKYNLLRAKERGISTVLTFGGAYSNHIAATAAAGKLLGIKTIGVIRGDELGKDVSKTLKGNETLRFASMAGMTFNFISRSQYKEKTTEEFLNQLQAVYGDCFIIPEGGTNALAVKGCEEILSEADKQHDIVCCAVGTGGTISGIVNSSSLTQQVLGFPALKGDFLAEEIKKYTSKTNWELVNEYHFGGYGKVNGTLIEFINTFTKEQKIVLDPVYTAKMIFGIFDKVEKGHFIKNTRILAIHTGGLQGIAGMNKKLLKKKMPLIEI